MEVDMGWLRLRARSQVWKRLSCWFVVTLVLARGTLPAYEAQAQLPQDVLSNIYTSIHAQEANFPLPTTDATITIGTIHVVGMGMHKLPNGIPLPEVYLEYSVPTYNDGTFVPSPPCGPPPGHPIIQPQMIAGSGVTDLIAPQAVHTPTLCPPRQANIGGKLTAANIRNLSVRFAIDGWPTSYPGPPSVTIALGSLQSQTVQAGAKEIVFSIGGSTSLPLKIDIVGAITVNDHSANLAVPGILPLQIERPVIGVGALTIPALPVSLIFAPVVDPQKKTSLPCRSRTGPAIQQVFRSVQRMAERRQSQQTSKASSI
jgi:hypothetical protein